MMNPVSKNNSATSNYIVETSVTESLNTKLSENSVPEDNISAIIKTHNVIYLDNIYAGQDNYIYQDTIKTGI